MCRVRLIWIFRHHIHLELRMWRVECQDEWRVFINYTLPYHMAIFNQLTEIMAAFLIDIKSIKPLDHETNSN